MCSSVGGTAGPSAQTTPVVVTVDRYKACIQQYEACIRGSFPTVPFYSTRLVSNSTRLVYEARIQQYEARIRAQPYEPRIRGAYEMLHPPLSVRASYTR